MREVLVDALAGGCGFVINPHFPRPAAGTARPFLILAANCIVEKHRRARLWASR